MCYRESRDIFISANVAWSTRSELEPGATIAGNGNFHIMLTRRLIEFHVMQSKYK